tara:strand:- start:293 stop:1069 length:777 start_codon:yes stop_codon:yes gene_type:complete
MAKSYLKKFLNKNKIAFVVGGSGFIGKEVTKALAESGAKVINLDVQNAFKNNKRVKFEKFDCSKTDLLRSLFDGICKKYKSPDIFVNCSYPRTDDWSSNSFEKISMRSYKKNLDIHLNSYVWLAKYAAEAMYKKKRGGSIIQFSSTYGLVGQTMKIYKGTNIKHSMTYSIIKGGISNLTRQMASYYGKFNIRVNSICPGGVLSSYMPKKFIKNYNEVVPMGRLCQTHEVASAVLFLSSDASSYITGTDFVIDGGWTCI